MYIRPTSLHQLAAIVACVVVVSVPVGVQASLASTSPEESRQSSCPTLESGDVTAWESTVWVHGEVLIMDHPVLGTTPANGEVIAFSRSGREKYTVKIRADLEGAYEVFLEPGRYRIIVPCLSREKTELLDSLTTGQARHLDVHEGRSVRFDVRIRTCDQ
jgi:hypothetical protein